VNLGFDRPLYILPFDHRGSFETKMFGWEGALAAAHRLAGREGDARGRRRGNRAPLPGVRGPLREGWPCV